MKLSILFILAVLAMLVLGGCAQKEMQEDTPAKDVNEQNIQMYQDNEQTPTVIDEYYCESDDDCECGMSSETADCAIGNYDYIDSQEEDCEVFCNGELGQYDLKCENNRCVSN